MTRKQAVNTVCVKYFSNVSDFMSCRWSDFITGQQIASFFVIDSFRCSGDFPPRIMTKYNWIVLLEFLQ